jgi:hypothetical protein
VYGVQFEASLRLEFLNKEKNTPKELVFALLTRFLPVFEHKTGI